MINERPKDKDAKIHFIETSPKVDVSFTYFGTSLDESFFTFIFMVRTTLKLNKKNNVSVNIVLSWRLSWSCTYVYQIQMEEDNKIRMLLYVWMKHMHDCVNYVEIQSLIWFFFSWTCLICTKYSDLFIHSQLLF